ncbi:hypothetical protein F5Y16DRAFT_199173 [Xylariaceae sp. FL0255]|nr:hypothetical protein F5Y16DRAFT_199173 [Xylariaceae sp. FL0255]
MALRLREAEQKRRPLATSPRYLHLPCRCRYCTYVLAYCTSGAVQRQGTSLFASILLLLHPPLTHFIHIHFNLLLLFPSPLTSSLSPPPILFYLLIADLERVSLSCLLFPLSLHPLFPFPFPSIRPDYFRSEGRRESWTLKKQHRHFSLAVDTT